MGCKGNCGNCKGAQTEIRIKKMTERTLILFIIATTIFTVVKCNRIEDADNIKQEQGDDTLPKEEKENTNKKDEQNKEESPVELG